MALSNVAKRERERERGKNLNVSEKRLIGAGDIQN